MKANGKLAPIAAGLLGVILFAGLLELAVRFGLVSRLIIAPPSSMPSAFAMLWHEGYIVEPFLATLGQTFVATLAAALVGIPTGYLLWRRPLLAAAYESWLGAAFAAPLILLYPLFLVIFGRGYTTTIFVGFLSSVIPIILKTCDGLRAVPRVFIHVGQSFHLSRWTSFIKIVFPAAAPAMLTGMRLGLIFAVVNIIGMEFLIDFGGLGRVVSEMYFRYEIAGMYAAILLILLVSLLFLTLFERIERWLRPH